MTHVREILETHPLRAKIDRETLSEAVEHISSCAKTCIACADACLAEETVARLVRCIRLNYDCADICEVTVRVLLRQVEPDFHLMRSQVELCLAASRVCAEECERHADHHEHCHVCAQSCHMCEKVCEHLLQKASVAR